jgi:hypothetical protein
MKMSFITSQAPNTECNFHVVIWSFCITIRFTTTTRCWIQDDSTATRRKQGSFERLVCMVISTRFRHFRKAVAKIRHYLCHVRPSVRTKQSCSHRTDFIEIAYLGLLQKSINTFRCGLKSDKNNRHFTWQPTNIYNISLLLLVVIETVFPVRYEPRLRKDLTILNIKIALGGL